MSDRDADEDAKTAARDDFFVGYLRRLPATLRGFLPFAALGLVIGFFGGALAISATQPNPGDGRIVGRPRAVELGVIIAQPYPHLRQAPTAEAPNGRTYLLVRPGKRGVQDIAARLDGEVVEVRGNWTERGEIRMIQVGQAGPAMIPAESDETPPDASEITPVEDLGRWRLSGEICDGKCYLGAMRPGTGLSHRACANLCVIGGAPPVLVTGEPVLGTEFLLVAGEDGGPAPDVLYDWIAVLMEAEGQLERHGDLLVFKIDFETIRAL